MRVVFCATLAAMVALSACTDPGSGRARAPAVTAQQFLAQGSQTTACSAATDRFDQAYDGGDFVQAQARARDARGPCRDALNAIEAIQTPAGDTAGAAFKTQCGRSYRMLVDWLGDVGRFRDPPRNRIEERRRGVWITGPNNSRDGLRRRQTEVNAAFDACNRAADAIAPEQPAPPVT